MTILTKEHKDDLIGLADDFVREHESDEIHCLMSHSEKARFAESTAKLGAQILELYEEARQEFIERQNYKEEQQENYLRHVFEEEAL